jgi:hypothetical protein
MPRVMRVAAARQRYERVPTIDPATGQQKTITMNRQARRTGRQVVQRVTHEDRTKPLPPYSCDACAEPIAVGTPYKYIDIKRQYGGTTRRRHAYHPDWQPWEYSSALWARIAQIQAMEIDVSGLEPGEDPSDYTDDIVSAIRELASEKEEAASNMEDGFGHETEQSNELREISEQLEAWADEFESIDWPEDPEPEEEDCPECGGTGKVEPDDPEAAAVDCAECDGTGQVTPDEPTEDQIDEWREAVEGEIQNVMDSAPV